MKFCSQTPNNDQEEPCTDRYKDFSNHDFWRCKTKELLHFNFPEEKRAMNGYSNQMMIQEEYGLPVITVDPLSNQTVHHTTPNQNQYQPPAGRCWLFTKERHQEFLGIIEFGLENTAEICHARKDFSQKSKMALRPRPFGLCMPDIPKMPREKSKNCSTLHTSFWNT